MIRFLLSGLLIVIFVVLAKNLPADISEDHSRAKPNSEAKITQSPEHELSSQDRIIQEGPFKIHSFEIAPVVGRTEIFINQFSDPVLSLDGFYYDSRFIDLDTNIDNKVFEIQINTGGKLLTSLVYRYEDESLIRIPVSTEKPGGYLGTVSSGGAEFKDVDGDNVKEMFVYHRHYPPEAKRTVEVYKFNGDIFQKYKEYEEAMEKIYL